MSTPPSTRPLRIVVADDHPDAADTLAALIELALPCEIVLAYDGLAAWRAVERERPDALLLDLQMPGLGGLEVARRARRHWGDDPPYIVALTGRSDAVADLAAIHDSFDRAFAKPVDVDQLVAALARLTADAPVGTHAIAAHDLSELVTRAARQVVPIAAARRLQLSFDCRGPLPVVDVDPVELHCGLHRLLLGLVDCIASGFVLFDAECRIGAAGRVHATVAAAGSGPIRDAAIVADVLRRLELKVVVPPAPGERLPRAAIGLCPNTGAPVSYAYDPKEGLLLRLQLEFPPMPADESPPRCPPGSRAWLVAESDIDAATLQRRLERLGWQVRRHADCAAAAAALPGGEGAPHLLIVVESARVLPAAADALQRRLPPQTQRVYAAMTGSPSLADFDGPKAFDVHLLPLGPRELIGFCEAAEPGAETRLHAPPAAAQRTRVMLVDDNEINRIVGRGLLEALGYEVHTAHDGLDAIEQCRLQPPDLVLMDIDMPVLGGIEATVRLRELQQSGGVAPFPILAATANALPSAAEACLRAGMLEVLPKPLLLERLNEALQRYAARG